jgi:hypothetical protein
MRLIDADKANEAVRKVLRKYGFSDESVVSDEVWDAIENEVPTAYDADNVVEQLNESDFYIDQEKCITVEDAISIVKGGCQG